ncbi:pilin [Patescibacteria group bacterium]|nr:pilin [Patescibacteria group bacterium]
MRKKLLIILLSTIILSSLGGMFQAFAAETTPPPTNGEEPTVVTPVIPKPQYLPGPDPDITVKGADTQNYILNTTIPRVINIVTALLALAAFIGIIITAINMLTAFGNEDKYTKAKNNMKFAISGFLVVIFSYAIVSVIVSLAFPMEEDQEGGTSFIPTAYAVDVEKDLDILFPKESDIIKDQGENREVSLPSGDFLKEIVPAAIVNVFYFLGFLVFIAFTVAGVLLISGRGNEDQVTKAKRIVTYSAIAIALMALGYALIYGLATLDLTKDRTSEEMTDESYDLYVEPSPQ